MPVPATTDELLDKLRRSGLVAPDKLSARLSALAGVDQPSPAPADVLADLVDAGLLTKFHADRLAAGKYKGFQLGVYQILDLLGSGGMGQVFLAEHAAMRRLVALKVLPIALCEDPVARERFHREARAAATLDHPNVVRVFDLNYEGRLLYLVMEYVEGVSLQSLVARLGPLDVTAACHYVRQVADGLRHASDQGFVHRDIKPSNLLLDRTGVVKILDLGLVRSEAEAERMLTRGMERPIVGTADYVSPEQSVDSSTVDIRADIYSLGATFYFMLAGRPLFPEGRTAQKLFWQQTRQPTPIRHLRPEVPEGLAAAISKMLQKRPEDRFQTPQEVLDALEPWDAGAVPPPDESVLPRPAARLLVARGYVPRKAPSSSSLLPRPGRSGPSSTVPRAGLTRRMGPAAAAPAPSVGAGSDGYGKSSALQSPSPSGKFTIDAAETPTAPLSPEVTQRSARPEDSTAEVVVVPITAPRRHPGWGPTAVVAALLVGTGLAVCGAVVWWLR